MGKKHWVKEHPKGFFLSWHNPQNFEFSAFFPQFFFFFKLIFIEVELIYNIVLLSTGQQNESAMLLLFSH